MKKNYIYQLESTNISGPGGQMGTDYTELKYARPFTTMEKAKKYAEKEYGKKIKWEIIAYGWSSGDLAYVMYDIIRTQIDAE